MISSRVAHQRSAIAAPGRAVLVAGLALAIASCGAPPSPSVSNVAPSAPPASTDAASSAPSEPSAVVATPAVDAPAPPRLGEGEIALMNQLARSTQVVRGRVAEAGTKRWDGGQGPFVVVEILEYIEGDEDAVVRGYRKGFPLFGTPMPSGAHKQLSSRQLEPLDSLLGLEGKERVFLLRLPTESSRGTVSWGPPPDLRARFGADVVGLVDHLDVDRIEAVRDARKNLTRESAWVKENAQRLVPHDRFVARAQAAAARGAIDDTVIDTLAEAASAEIAADLARALGKPIARTLAKRSAKDASVSHLYDLRVDGEPALDSTLSLRHLAASGALASASVSAPLVKRLSAASSAASKREAVMARIKTDFGARLEGGLTAEHVAYLSRGDGAQLVEVTLGSPTRIGTSPARARTLRFVLTQPDLALFEYKNDFAR